MEPQKAIELLKDYKNIPNKDLENLMDFLNEDFSYTKDLIIKLTKHLDTTEKSYNTIYTEYKKRINNVW